MRVVLVIGVLLSGCGARTELYVAEQDTVELAPECTEEGATRVCESVCEAGLETCFDGKWRFCSAGQPRPPRLEAVVRDFSSNHPDFEHFRVGFDPGLVGTELGSDDKPVYVATNSITTSGRANFDTWYRDTEQSTRLETVIELLPSESVADLFVYENSAFFPIDDLGFGNEGRRHNFHFTLEVSTSFRYKGGEVFTFTGDDDLWVFINRRLAIDLGGVHGSMTDSVQLDASSADLDLVQGEVYPLHLFFAERHTIDSNFNVATTIAEFELCN